MTTRWLSLALAAILALPLPAQAAAEELKSRMSGYFPAYVKDLETLTNIDSGTGNQEGSRRIAAFLRDRLTALGGTVSFRENDRGTHVIARFKGTGKLKLLLMAHTDTVFAPGEAAKRPFRMDARRRAFGPGVGDDKATVVQTLYAMQLLKDLDFKDYAEIVLYYDAEEETGSAMGEAIIKQLARASHVVFVLDTARPGWGVLAQRKGMATYEISVTGRSGHAGNAPHHSASAIMELAHQISGLYRLASPLPEDPARMTHEALAARGIQSRGQFIPENTINVGVIESSNRKTNVIPADARARLEVRAFSQDELVRLDTAIRELAAKPTVPGTTVTLEGGIVGAPMEKTPAVSRLIATYGEVVKRTYGAEIVEWRAGGLTDGNVSAPVAPTIDGLGVENYDEHTDREWVDLNTAEPRTVALVEFIRELARTWHP